MGLASQPGNRVTISYRKEAFTRLKDRNERRLRDALRGGQLEVIFGSEPVEIRPGATSLAVGDARCEVAADFVWIFAGGTPPKAFLESIGIAFGRQDLAPAARAEAAESRRVAAA